ncbi:MAG: sulfite exporter TauE/SafE family protein [Lachnospiraceae bacterium]
MQVKLYIDNMHCINCQKKIETNLKNREGIISVKVSYMRGVAQIDFDETQIGLEEINEIIEKLDYQVKKKEERKRGEPIRTIGLLVIIGSLYIILQSMGILNILVPGRLADQGMGYGMLFMIGLLTSVHCLAMCGGINLSQCLLPIEEAGGDGNVSFLSSILYNLGRVVSYTMSGFVLGLMGFLLVGVTNIGISVHLQGVLKMIAGIFMLIMGINMLGIFPVLRRFTIRTPKFITRIVGKERAKTRRPFLIGILNGFMPCGPLQSMWIVALATANPLTGALSMLFFSIGTVPLMLGFGTIVTALGKKATNEIQQIGAILVVVLGLAMVSQGSALSGIGTSSSSFTKNEKIDNQVEIVDGAQVVNSTLLSRTYPNISVQAGIPVRWTIDAPEGSINGCNYKFIIREYDIEHTFTEGKNIIEFTPTEEGSIRYTCWMGMINGRIEIEEQ